MHYTCPFCGRDATLTNPNISETNHFFDNENCDGERCVTTAIYVCPNKDCRKFSLLAVLQEAKYHNGVGYRVAKGAPLIGIWNLIPSSKAKVFPDYVPQPIRADYEEACLIRDLSPKASATLSRRCLQGIIRDYFGESHSTLNQEINAIETRIDPLLYEAIDAVRQVGNIGAHMEKDINIIVDVEPTEAQALIELIETLLEETYVLRFNRQQRLKTVSQIADAKKLAKVATPPALPPAP